MRQFRRKRKKKKKKQRRSIKINNIIIINHYSHSLCPSVQDECECYCSGNNTSTGTAVTTDMLSCKQTIILMDNHQIST